MDDQKLLLLGLLRQQEMHGYQLVEWIEQALAACTDLRKPGAYYLLKRMAQDGWIEERSEQEGNRPPRRVFRLTEQGQQAFLRLERESLGGYQAPTAPGDMGLAFADALPAAEARALLTQRRAAILTALQAARAAPAHPGGVGRLLQRHIRLLETDLAWTDEQLRQDDNEIGSHSFFGRTV